MLFGFKIVCQPKEGAVALVTNIVSILTKLKMSTTLGPQFLQSKNPVRKLILQNNVPLIQSADNSYQVMLVISI